MGQSRVTQSLSVRDQERLKSVIQSVYLLLEEPAVFCGMALESTGYIEATFIPRTLSSDRSASREKGMKDMLSTVTNLINGLACLSGNWSNYLMQIRSSQWEIMLSKPSQARMELQNGGVR